MRYTPKGSLDPTFGGSGQLTLTLGGDQVATALALTSDGKLVVAGRSTTVLQGIGPSNAPRPELRFALARYLGGP